MNWIKRRTAAVAAPLLALALTAAVSTAAERTITRSQAASVAAAINLRQRDLSGYAGTSNPVTAEERKQGDQVATCYGGVPESDALAVAQSPNFSPRSNPNSLTISSATEIMPSAKLVAKDLAGIEGPRGLACLQSELKPRLQASVGKGSTVSLTSARVPFAVSGADGSFAVTIKVSLGIKQGKKTVKVPLYADEIGFTLGQAEVALDIVATGGGRPSTSLKRRLVAALLARAKSAIG
jgi:hypothetical protein